MARAATAYRPATRGKAAPALRVERFFARHLRHMKARWAGEPFLLEKWQREEIIRPIFGTLDRKGLRKYREALIGLPRKNGKSEIAAGIMLYGLFADGEFGSECYSLAGSRDQARLVFKVARDMVEASPLLRASSRIYKNAIEVPETNSVYRVLSADAGLQHGLNPHMAVVDEYHVHRNPDQYEAMVTGTAARLQPLILTITTAGFDRTTPAYALYERGRASRRDPRFYFRWWEVPENAKLLDTRAWRRANPASWVTIPFLRDQYKRLPEPVFRQLHLNQWVDVNERWLDLDVWAANDADPHIDPDRPVYIGVDSAPKHDTTAVVMVQRQDDGTYDVRTWVFRADRIMGYTDFVLIEDLLRQLCSTFVVERIVVDPYAMIRSMMMLAAEGLPIEDFPQSDARMVPASQNLYDLITEHRLRHGKDPELTDAVTNAGVMLTARGWRLHKLKSTRPIDAATALAQACYIAEQDAGTYSDGPNVIIV